MRIVDEKTLRERARKGEVDRRDIKVEEPQEPIEHTYLKEMVSALSALKEALEKPTKVESATVVMAADALLLLAKAIQENPPAANWHFKCNRDQTGKISSIDAQRKE